MPEYSKDTLTIQRNQCQNKNMKTCVYVAEDYARFLTFLIFLTAKMPITNAMPEPIIVDSDTGSSIGGGVSVSQLRPKQGRNFAMIVVSEHCSSSMPSLLHSSNCCIVAFTEGPPY